MIAVRVTCWANCLLFINIYLFIMDWTVSQTETPAVKLCSGKGIKLLQIKTETKMTDYNNQKL